MSVATPGLVPTSGMANDTVNKLLDFSQKLDIGLLVSILSIKDLQHLWKICKFSFNTFFICNWILLFVNSFYRSCGEKIQEFSRKSNIFMDLFLLILPVLITLILRNFFCMMSIIYLKKQDGLCISDIYTRIVHHSYCYVF